MASIVSSAKRRKAVQQGFIYVQHHLWLYLCVAQPGALFIVVCIAATSKYHNTLFQDIHKQRDYSFFCLFFCLFSHLFYKSTRLPWNRAASVSIKLCHEMAYTHKAITHGHEKHPSGDLHIKIIMGTWTLKKIKTQQKENNYKWPTDL